MKQKPKDKEKKDKVDPENEYIEFDSPEDLQKFLESLKNRTPEKKTRVIGLSSRIIANFYLNAIFFLGLNSLISLALIGYLDLVNYKSFWQLIIFIISFTVIEVILKDILYRKFPYFIFATMGIILLMISIFSILIPLFVIPGLEFISTDKLILYLIGLLVTRTMITQYLIQQKRKKIMSQKRQ